MTAFLEQGGGVGPKYPRLMSEKIMTAYMGFEVDVLKNENRKTNDYCRVSIGIGLIPRGN